VDLRPVPSNQSQLHTAEDLEEPTAAVPETTETDTVGMENPNSTAPTHTRRRMSRLLDFNRLRHAAPEERIAALRQLRTRDGNPNTAATTPDDPEAGDTAQAPPEIAGATSAVSNNEDERGITNVNPEERRRRSRFTRTLRAAFDIRTTTASGNSAAPAGDASMTGGRGA